MASKRVRRRRTLEEIEGEVERRRAADNDADREYTTPERLAALRGEPDLRLDGAGVAGTPEGWARASPPGATGRRHEAEPTPEVDFDAEVEERIRDEIDDFEREASCAPRGAALRVEARAGERVPPGPPAEDATARSRAKRRRGPQPFRRIDSRAAAPEAFAAMERLEASVRGCGLERSLLELVELRASQLNGCASCAAVHRRDARRAGEAERRLDALERWSDARLFTDRERAALAWTEAVTRLGPGGVGDRTARLVREQFSDPELVKLTMAIVAINARNRLVIALRAERGPRRGVAFRASIPPHVHRSDPPGSEDA